MIPLLDSCDGCESESWWLDPSLRTADGALVDPNPLAAMTHHRDAHTLDPVAPSTALASCAGLSRVAPMSRWRA